MLVLSGCGSAADPSPTSTTQPSETDLIEPAAAKDFVPVPCDGGTGATSLVTVAEQLGYDKLVLFHGRRTSGGEIDLRIGAMTPEACRFDTPCPEFARAAVEKSLRRAEDGETAVWTFRADADTEDELFASVLIGRRGETWTSVATTAELRTFLGALDTPWKAYLFVLATSSEHPYNVTCEAHIFGYCTRPTTYLRTAGPVQIIGVQSSSDDSIDTANRGLLSVDQAGAASLVSSSTITRDTKCVE